MAAAPLCLSQVQQESSQEQYGAGTGYATAHGPDTSYLQAASFLPQVETRIGGGWPLGLPKKECLGLSPGKLRFFCLVLSVSRTNTCSSQVAVLRLMR